jgi:outer membrane protein TolC
LSPCCSAAPRSRRAPRARSPRRCTSRSTRRWPGRSPAAASPHRHGARRRAARAGPGSAHDRLPRLEVAGQWFGNTGDFAFGIPQGALGADAQGRPVPFADRQLAQRGGAAAYGTVTVAQPVTQLVRIGAGARAAAAAAREGEAAREQAALDVALGAERLYLAALVADRRRDAAALSLAAREAQASDAVRAVQAGLVLDVRRQEAHAGVLDASQALVAADNAAADARAELASCSASTPTRRSCSRRPRCPRG